MGSPYFQHFAVFLVFVLFGKCTGCGFTRQLENELATVTITSPGYPLEDYVNNLRCLWSISAPAESRTHKWLLIEMQSFDTERNYDKLKVNSYPEISGHITTRQRWRTFGSTANISFTSDASTVREGFRFIVRAIDVPPVCGGIVSVPDNVTTGELMWPPSTMPSSTISMCIWFLSSEKQRSMDLVLETFSMKLATGCPTGQQLFVKRSSEEHTICNQAVGWRTHGTSLMVTYKTNVVSQQGFKFQYNVCGFSQTLENQDSSLTITSPNFPSQYRNHANCIWEITAPPSSPTHQWVTAEIETFRTEQNYDLLEVEEFAKASGTVTSKTWHSVGQTIRLHFETDASTGFMGFRLILRPATAPACGGTVRIPAGTPEGLIRYPPLPPPGSYPMECLWYISSEISATLDLALENLDVKSLATNANCDGAIVNVKTKKTPTSTQTVDRICTTGSFPIGWKTHGSLLKVYLHRRNLNLTQKGFRFRYKVCGYTKTMASANEVLIVSTIRFPNAYPSLVNCKWEITAPTSSTTHKWLRIVSHGFDTQATNDKVMMEDYPPISGTLVNPPTWYSIGSTTRITFTSDSTVQNNGFNLTVTAISMAQLCHSTTTLASQDETKIILSPRYPYNYTSNSDCLWTVSAPTASTTHRWLIVMADNLDLEAGQDFLRIDNFTAVTGRINSQRGWHSKGSTVRIRFTSNANNHGRGFNLTVRATDVAPPDCERDIVIPADETGDVIQWPLSPPSGNTLGECVWNIRDSQQRSIDLKLETFSAKVSSSADFCGGVILDLENRKQTSTDTHRLCHVGTFAVGWGVHGRIFNIKFESAIPNLGTRGFKIRYTACGLSHTLTSDNDKLSVISPRFPSQYPNLASCVWNISAPPSSATNKWLSVVSSAFNTQPTNDVVTIAEYPSLSGSVSATTPWYSIASNISIRFQSDAATTNTGFNFTVTAVAMNNICGYTTRFGSSSEHRIVLSPRYPQHYPVNSNCVWEISTPLASTFRWLLVSANSVDLESDQDFLQIDNFTAVTGTVSAARSWHTKGSTVRIRFTSNANNQRPGFNLTVRPSDVAPPSCGQTIVMPETESEGELRWPQTPPLSSSLVDCDWIISNARGRGIQLELVQFSLKASSTATNCGGANLVIENRGTTTQTHQICTSTNYAAGWSDYGTNFAVKFSSTESNLGNRGFYIRYKACGFERTLTNANEKLSITSPLYPNQYSNSANCEWKISAPAGSTTHQWLKIESHAFSTQASLDSVVIEDYPALSGTVTNQHWFSVGSTLSVRFTSDASVTNTGFNFTVSAVTMDELCGLNYTLTGATDVKTFNSPRYPYNYTANSNCTWLINAPLTNSFDWVVVTVINLDLETNDDFLLIDNYTAITGNISTPSAWHSKSSTARIVFTSNAAGFGRGFNISVNATDKAPPACGGRRHLRNHHKDGFLRWPLIPPTNTSLAECAWQLSAAGGRSMQLTLEEFSMRASNTSDYCSGGTLDVFAQRNMSNQNFSLCNAEPFAVGWVENGITFSVNFTTRRTTLGNRGFVLRYEACGYTATVGDVDDKLSLISPRYPNEYPNYTSCVWTFDVPKSPSRFKWFSVVPEFYESQENQDFLQIEDYPYIFGSRNASSKWYSIGSRIRIRFKADGTITARGFNLTVELVSMDELCTFSSAVLADVNDTKMIKSPRYPFNYTSNTNCTWEVSAPMASVTYRWLIVSMKVLEMEDENDFVQVDDYTPISGTFFVPRAWHSKTSTVRIHMTSNNGIQKRGFNLTIRATNTPPPRCGGDILIPGNESTREIKWPPSENQSSSLVECFWSVRAANNRKIFLYLEEFSVKVSDDGDYCHGIILDVGQNVNGSVETHQLCKSANYSVGWSLFSSNYSVKFGSTMEHLGNKTFKLIFTACGYKTVLPNKNASETINSPGFPIIYPDEANCRWTVSIPYPIRKYVIDLHHLSLYSATDSLQIGNRLAHQNMSNTSMDIPPGTVNIHFLSDVNGTGDGFNLTVRVESLSCADVNCSHNCTIIEHVPRCSCPDEEFWTMSSDNQTCLDVDECAPDHPTVCHGFANCTNLEGSYYCNCTHGYKMIENGNNCTDLDGNWTVWTNWTTCSKSCGGGIHYSNRTCTNPKPVNDGMMCLMLNNLSRGILEMRMEQCNNATCPLPPRGGSWLIPVAVVLGLIIFATIIVIIICITKGKCKTKVAPEQLQRRHPDELPPLPPLEENLKISDTFQIRRVSWAS